MHGDLGQAASHESRRQAQYIDALYRERARNRTDVEKLRKLHDAINECVKDGV